MIEQRRARDVLGDALIYGACYPNRALGVLLGIALGGIALGRVLRG